MYVTYCRVISKQVCLVTTNSTHNREYCDEVLKKKHNRYAQKQKQRVPTAEEQWLLTPSFRQYLWEAALHSLLSPHSPAERNPPCSSFQPCPMESTWAWPPSCAHRHKPSQTLTTLALWDSQSPWAKTKCHCQIMWTKMPRNTILPLSASCSCSRSPNKM